MADVSSDSVQTAASADNIPPISHIPKMSFASVSQSSDTVGLATDQSKVAAMAATPKAKGPAAPTSSAGVENRLPPAVSVARGKTGVVKPESTALHALQESVARLNIAGNPVPGPVIASADTDVDQPQPLQSLLQHDDEKTHLSSVSNPTMSTDMRSIVSGTAFNMDEKESIRPDESASVKATDESDSLSGQGSGGVQSQAPSEAGKDGFQDQFQEVSTAKKALPLTANLVGRVPDDVNRTTMPAALEFQPQGPDEKLLDALENPKDRIFLLQLEQQVIAFISNSKEQVLSLPPQNSFCRLLAHRLGDYYSLSHTADANLGSVRLGKTETTKLPPSLKTIAIPNSPESGAPQAQQPALKIMRRNKPGGYGKDGESGEDTVDESGVQSPNGSDTGASGTDLQRSPSKALKHMTREEREAHYQATRDRIFGDMDETKPSTETSTVASRASSTTGGKAKKHKNRPKNDDFEPRSMFTSGYHQQQQQVGFSYNDRQQQQIYGFPPQNGPGMPPNSMAGGYADMGIAQHPGFPQQPVQGQHMPMQQPMQMGGGMPIYGQPNYPQQQVYNGNYGYGGQGQSMAQMPMQQQQYYPAPDQGSSYNNMMGAPMMNSHQQGYQQGYQGWNQTMPMQYGGQDQGYFPQGPQNGAPSGMMYHNPQKQMEGNTPPAVRYNPGEYPMGAATQHQQQQHGQWQWQGPPPYGPYPNMQTTWQGGQPGPHMSPSTMMQPQKMNAYPSPNMGSGKPNKKGGHKTAAKASELGKYDTSSLPPKPPAPAQGDQ